MSLARSITIVTATVVALINSSHDANANPLKNLFYGVQQVQSQFDGTSNGSPGVVLPIPPHYGRPHPRPGDDCPPKYCPPVWRIYNVYYYDCHGYHHRWKRYGTYRSRRAAEEARYSLQRRGYRTYLQVRRVGRPTNPGFPADPGYPADAGLQSAPGAAAEPNGQGSAAEALFGGR